MGLALLALFLHFHQGRLSDSRFSDGVRGLVQMLSFLLCIEGMCMRL